MAFLEFMPGALAPDDATPPTWDNSSVVFEADGSEHKGGWSVYVPADIVSASSTTLRIYFIDEGVGTGNVRFSVEYYASSETSIIGSGAPNIDVTVPNVAGSVFYTDVDISAWIPAGTVLLFITLTRDSSDAADTYASDIGLALGRTLEV